jgi:glycosyltransferase involved in cell wall biosynthesis
MIKGLGPGGAERLLVSVAATTDPALVRHEVAYVLPHKDDLVAELEARGVRCHLLGRRGMADPRWLLGLAALVRSSHPDVVHIHSPAVAGPTRLIARLRRRRPAVITTEHNVCDSYARLTRWTNRVTAPLDDHRIAVSSEVEASMPRRLANRTEVVVHGIPIASTATPLHCRTTSREALGLEPGDVVVAVVANLRAGKDHTTLLRAARAAMDDAPELRFVSIGDGALGPELRALAGALGLGDRFEFLGSQPDPARILAGCDVFTLSSLHEGLSIALLEAIALGLPAVVTDVGANALVIRHQIEGLVVPAADPAGLARAYVALARDPKRRATMGAAARERARDFDIRRTTSRLESIYQATRANDAR